MLFVLSLVCAITAGLLNIFSLIVLADTGRYSRANSYAGIAKYYYGKIGTNVVDLTIIVLLFGALVAYCILMADMIHDVIEAVVNHPVTSFYADRPFILAILVPIAFPFTLARELDALRYVSGVGILFLLYLSGVIVYRYFDSLQDGERDDIVSFEFSMDAFLSLPLQMAAYCGHFNAVEVNSGLENPTQARTYMVGLTSIIIVFLFNSIVGLTGYLTFGADTLSSVINNYQASDQLISYGRAALTFTLFCTYPLFMMPLRSSINNVIKENLAAPPSSAAVSAAAADGDEAAADTLTVDSSDIASMELGVCPNSAPSSSSAGEGQSLSDAEEEYAGSMSARIHDVIESPWFHTGEMLFLNLVIYMVAVVAPDFGFVLGILGSSATMVIAFILPGMFGYKAYKRQQKAGMTTLCLIMIVLAVIMGVVGVAQNFAA